VWAADEVHRIQAASEGITWSGSVTFRGKKYRLGRHGADNLMPQLAFAQAADAGMDSGSPRGLAAMYEMIRGCFIQAPACGTCEACDDDRFDECPQFDGGDWPRFRRVSTAVCAGPDEILAVVRQAMEQITARPTSAPPASSPPAPASSVSLRDPSSSQADIVDLAREAAGQVTGHQLSREEAQEAISRLPAAFRRLPDGDLIDLGRLARSQD